MSTFGQICFWRTRAAPRWTAVIVALAALAGLTETARAEVTLPDQFSDRMVLQQDVPVPVWGWADPDEEITVTIASRQAMTRAGADGRWSVSVPSLATAVGIDMVVRGKDTKIIYDVCVGEVWFCSGQSNMQFRMSKTEGFAQEKPKARYPQIRLFEVASAQAREPQTKAHGKWVVTTPESVALFSGVAYYFGRDLHVALNRPVGLINASVGGSLIEAWTSLEAQRDLAGLQPLLASWAHRQATWNPQRDEEDFKLRKEKYDRALPLVKAGQKPPRPPVLAAEPDLDPNHPATLFNGMVAPLIPYAVRGILWYQGESNATMPQAALYREQLPRLIADWRRRWAQPELPFAWVQLPNFKREGLPLVREAMLETLAVPRTGMAVTIDIGDSDNIHPTNKRDVGDRLARWALAEVYEKGGEGSSPLPTAYRIDGAKFIVSFAHATGGLTARGGRPDGFELAGSDRAWHPAVGKIDGTDVVLASDAVPEPVAVRYAWSDDPKCNLYSGAGLPASPFRTDRWPIAGAVATAADDSLAHRRK